MPLTPKTEALLKKVLETRETHITEMPVTKIREVALKAAQDLGGLPKPVKKVDNIEIDGPNGKIAIRTYTPNINSNNQNHPALIYFFGGGFVWGSLDTHDTICRDLTHATNCKVISISYRLGPEYKFPIAVNEAYTATKWIFNNADKLNIDPKKIAISGYSAGGNLAALTAIKARNDGLHLAYQILMCPWLDLSCSFPSYKKNAQSYYILDQLTLDFCVKHYLPKEISAKDPHVSPIWEKNLSNLPPTLIITAEFDPFIDEDEQYANKLLASGVKASHSCYKGQIHAFIAYRGMLELEKDPIDEIGTTLRDFFGS